jgi:hypothetical protein
MAEARSRSRRFKEPPAAKGVLRTNSVALHKFQGLPANREHSAILPVEPGNQSKEFRMKTVIIAIALSAGALFGTAASAAPLTNGVAVIPDNGIENVRMVCNEYGRCWRERGARRVIVEDSYGYAPRERYIERRGYYDDGPRVGIGVAPGVGIGVGPGGVGVGVGVGPRW